MSEKIVTSSIPFPNWYLDKIIRSIRGKCIFKFDYKNIAWICFIFIKMMIMLDRILETDIYLFFPTFKLSFLN